MNSERRSVLEQQSSGKTAFRCALALPRNCSHCCLNLPRVSGATELRTRPAALSFGRVHAFPVGPDPAAYIVMREKEPKIFRSFSSRTVRNTRRGGVVIVSGTATLPCRTSRSNRRRVHRPSPSSLAGAPPTRGRAGVPSVAPSQSSPGPPAHAQTPKCHTWCARETKQNARDTAAVTPSSSTPGLPFMGRKGRVEIESSHHLTAIRTRQTPKID